jgi:hypothetical protein
MENLKNRTVLVYDYGVFVETALRLSRDFGKVYYYNVWKESFPTSNKGMVGTGFKEINKVEEFWSVADEVDLFVFPDIYDSDLQKHLVKIGKRVWGSKGADILEIDRFGMKKKLYDAKMPVNNTDSIKGLDKLVEFLKNKKNKFIKISKWRGDMESFHHLDYVSSKPFFDDLAARIGPKQSELVFLAEDPIDGIETGFDGYTVDGKMPNVAVWGFEIKDNGYLAKFEKYESLPDCLKKTNEFLRKVFQENKSRTIFSTEVRVSKNKAAYLLDPCIRQGSPPSESFMEAVENFSQILWEGAGGNIIDPVYKYKYFTQINIESDWAKTHWIDVKIEDDARRWVKLRNCCKVKDALYVVPKDGDSILGTVIGLGNTIDEAFNMAKKNVEKVKAYELDFDSSFFDKEKEEIKKAKEYGVNFN